MPLEVSKVPRSVIHTLFFVRITKARLHYWINFSAIFTVAILNSFFWSTIGKTW